MVSRTWSKCMVLESMAWKGVATAEGRTCPDGLAAEVRPWTGCMIPHKCLKMAAVAGGGVCVAAEASEKMATKALMTMLTVRKQVVPWRLGSLVTAELPLTMVGPWVLDLNLGLLLSTGVGSLTSKVCMGMTATPEVGTLLCRHTANGGRHCAFTVIGNN